jgi:hypothetical protein
LRQSSVASVEPLSTTSAVKPGGGLRSTRGSASDCFSGEIMRIPTISPPRAPDVPEEEGRRGLLVDLAVVLAGVAMVVLVALAGWRLIHRNVDIFLFWPPLLAFWEPHVGPGTIAAVLVAGVVALAGPGAAVRLGWRPLMAVAWVASAAWIFSLAMVDGFSRGVAGRLTSGPEYLHDVPRVGDITQMVRGFSAHILTDQPEAWTIHVGAHPPGVFLLFVWLDRLGLGGGGAAGVFCILVGSSACVAVALTLRAFGAETTARAVLPFGVLIPGAVWIGVSADGMFAGVLAWGIALLALGVTNTGWRADLAAIAGGIVLGYTLFLSYGLALAAPLAVVVLVAGRRWRPALLSALGAGAVVAVFAAAGFWWLTGYALVKVIYATSIAQTRPYGYFIWADIAALLFALGPAVLAGLRRVARRPRSLPAVAVWLAVAALLAVLAADVSGMSKGEVERIWLPFAMWLVLPCALLPRAHHRGWLAAQALLALLVNHLLATVW